VSILDATSHIIVFYHKVTVFSPSKERQAQIAEAAQCHLADHLEISLVFLKT
jgi:hypothetical protein